MKQVASVSVSTVDKKSSENERAVRLCNYVDVYKNDLIDASLDFMQATASPSQIRSFGLRAGDTVITKDSETADDIAVPAYIVETIEGLVCGYHLAVVRPGPRLDPKYLFWCLTSQPMREQAAVAATGVTRFGLRQQSIRNTFLSLPSLSEQRRIADFLDSETTHIERLQVLLGRVGKLLEERRQACVRHAVADLGAPTRKPVHLGWVASVPADWPVIPLKHVARYGSGHTPSRTHPEYWVDCNIPWISLFDVGRMRDPRMERIYETSQSISNLGIANSSACVHPAGTVVLSRTASVGFAAIMGVEMAVSQHFATWTCGPRLLPEYLLHLLRAMKQTWQSLQVGTTNVTVFMPDLMALSIPLPPLDEQRAIVSRIASTTAQIDKMVDHLVRQRRLLAERRQALITAGIMGDLATARGAT